LKIPLRTWNLAGVAAGSERGGDYGAPDAPEHRTAPCAWNPVLVQFADLIAQMAA